ncbi:MULTISPECIES: ABC transporter permease [Bacillaceae]|uniref:YhgE/Pip domain-containing protein n=1 Tax=Bacillaceae TaxID=186817 RepID=UPI000E732493|nr:ABC transporter permease [Bacillus sp. PK3_68]RJS61367.1 hypothetical protein CJ483_16025 [Bacillus sp. PK3_68]
MNALKYFFRQPETFVGILAAAAFQIIFFCVWMTAYDGVDERIENLQIGIVNEDTRVGRTVEQNLARALPFKLEKYESLAKARVDMNKRHIDMIIQIPKTLSEDIQSGSTGNVVYWINQANASMAKSMMESTASQVTSQVNNSLFLVQKSELSGAFQQQITHMMPAGKSAEAVSQSVTELLKQVKDEPVKSSIVKTNKAKGFAATMVPMMIVLSSFVGAMVLTMQLQNAAQKLKSSFGKWELFFSRQIMNIAVSFLLVILTVGLMVIFKIGGEHSLIAIYLFQALVFWAFLSFAQMFVFLFGNGGMVFNILALSLQLVTSGVIVPKAVLANGYSSLGGFLPATYAADGYYTIVFGGDSGNISGNMGQLLLMIFVTMIVSATAVSFKRARSPQIAQEQTAQEGR